MLSLVGGAGYALTRIAMAAGGHSYTLTIIQCVAGIIALTILQLVARKYERFLSPPLLTVWSLFIFAAIFMGEVCDLYRILPFWDSVLHAFSGAALGLVGRMLAKYLTNRTPFATAVFAFCFAATICTLWEIYEFAFDIMLDLNMQRYMTTGGGEIFVGKAALLDTMQDIIYGVAAAFITVFGILFYQIAKTKRESKLRL